MGLVGAMGEVQVQGVPREILVTDKILRTLDIKPEEYLRRCAGDAVINSITRDWSIRGYLIQYQEA